MLTPRNVEISRRGARAADRKGLLQPVLTAWPRSAARAACRSVSSDPGTWRARWRAAGASPCSCTDVAARERAAGARRRRLGGEVARLQRRARRGGRPRRALPQAAAAGGGRRRDRPHAQGASPRSSAPSPLGDAARPPTATCRSTASCPRRRSRSRQGVVCHAPTGATRRRRGRGAVRAARHARDASRESHVDVAMGLMSNAPAYWRSSPRRRSTPACAAACPPALAAELVVQTMAGTAAADPRARDCDTLAGAPRGHVARRLDRPRPRRARARPACAPPSATRSTPSWTASMTSSLASTRTRDRGLRQHARPRLRDPDHRLHPDASCYFGFGGRIPYARWSQRGPRVPARGRRAVPARSSAASSRRSARSTSARSSRSSLLQIVGGHRRRALIDDGCSRAGARGSRRRRSWRSCWSLDQVTKALVRGGVDVGERGRGLPRAQARPRTQPRASRSARSRTRRPSWSS